MRAIDSLRFTGDLTLESSVLRREIVLRVLDRLEIIELTAAILRRAGQPMVAPLKTLDAIHLATAELWRETRGEEILFATHDRALGLGARSAGFKVLGG